MCRVLLAALILAMTTSAASAKGLLVPDDVKLAPLALVTHHVTVAIDDQVAVTTVEQVFRNHTDRNLEATYLFPVPKGATVNKFTMWIDGKETSGELLDAKTATDVYTSIVRRTQDPGLLEYMGNSLMRLKVFPIPPKGDQKVKIRYTSVAQQDAGVVEYIYPLKTDGKGTQTLKEFSVRINIKSQHPLQSIYSPTHAVDIKRKNEKEADIEFEKTQAILDKDFQLFYSVGNKEIGLTPVLYRPVSSEDGYFMFLISPQVEASKNRVPRDVVMVLDTSGSMSDIKMSQAKKALKQCLGQLTKDDRFALVSFATAVRTYKDTLTDASADQLEKAEKWVDDLRAGGGTAILPALNTALDLRGKDDSRSFNVVFFTDGQPTVDERNPVKIVKSVVNRNSTSTRIFTFGVGDDVNAAMLDQLADETRAVSTYVRPAEDIEAKAAALYAKISHPVMTNVKLSCPDVRLLEVYPTALPDLFHGGQLVVFGRFNGHGNTVLKLTGQVGKEQRELAFDIKFPVRTDSDTGREFVEHLWARRKVGFILDQIRNNGEAAELVQEVTALAKKYGIATPYTSYLVVPDGPMPVVQNGPGRPGAAPGGPIGSPFPAALAPGGGFGGNGGGIGGFAGGKPMRVDDFVKELAKKDEAKGEGFGANRGAVQDNLLKAELEKLSAEDRKQAYAETLRRAREQQQVQNAAAKNYRDAKLSDNQTGKLGVDLAESSNQLRQQVRLTQTANKLLLGRNCVEIGGVWVDDQFKAETKTLAVKAQSDAYFAILKAHPTMKEVFRAGNHLVWMTPSGTALVIDANDGKEKLTDAEIEALFAVKK